MLMDIPHYETKSGQMRKTTPKQDAYHAYYTDPNSETYCNAYQSAIKAGFSDSYARSITHQSPDWMTADARRVQMLHQAEKNLQAIANWSEEDFKHNPQMYKIWQDTNKFLSERLGKEHYSTRSEVTGKGGKQLFSEEHRQIAEQALSSLFTDEDTK